MTRRRQPPPLGLAPRLLAAFVLVVLVGSVTAVIVAAAVGPPLFNDHLRRSGAGATPAQTQHAEEAYRSANALSLSVALLAALVAAMGVSVYATNRIGRSVATAAATAADVADGHYETRIPPPGIGKEFDELAGAFNEMAARLGAVETTRRRLLADLAHEIRTPVATLDAYLEGVEDGVATLDLETVAMLRTQTARLTRLVEDLNAISRAEEHRLDLRPRTVAPAELVTAAVAAAAEPYAAKGVQLRSDITPGLSTLTVDPDRLAQVLANLLDNALRHTPAGGAVTVSARPSGTGVQVTVSDTGEGINAEHLPRVFERFYRADTARDRDHGGSGIGLAIVKALVEAHGGRINATSPGPGKGSTFDIWLPAD